MARVDAIAEHAQRSIEADGRVDLPVQPDCDLLVVPAELDAVLIGGPRSVVRLVERIEAERLVRVNRLREPVVVVDHLPEQVVVVAGGRDGREGEQHAGE
jgi:hypothetical protein